MKFGFILHAALLDCLCVCVCVCVCVMVFTKTFLVILKSEQLFCELHVS